MGVKIMWTAGMLLVGLIIGFTSGRVWEMRQQFLREEEFTSHHSGPIGPHGKRHIIARCE